MLALCRLRHEPSTTARRSSVVGVLLAVHAPLSLSRRTDPRHPPRERHPSNPAPFHHGDDSRDRRLRSSRRSCGGTSPCICTERSCTSRYSKPPRRGASSSSLSTSERTSAHPESTSYTRGTLCTTYTTCATVPWRSSRMTWSSPFWVSNLSSECFPLIFRKALGRR